MRLYGGLLREGEGGAEPGTVLGLEDGRLMISALGGRIGVAKLKQGAGKKLPAAEAGLGAGEKLA